MTDTRRFAVICGLMCTLCVALKLQTWFFIPRAENDERIYWELTDNWLRTGHYSLQGTAVLRDLGLPPETYDRLLFHHPPLLPLLLAPFVMADSPRAAIVVSWLGHILAIIGVTLFVFAFAPRPREAASGIGGAVPDLPRGPTDRAWAIPPTHIAIWLPMLACALDPLMTFCSRKLWPDNLVGGLDGLAIGLITLGVCRRRPMYTAAGSVAIGLAGLTKVSGLMVAPIALMAIMWGATHDEPAMRKRHLAALWLPAPLLMLPWFLVFYHQYGVFMPTWINPQPAVIAGNEFIRRAMERTWTYYLTEPIMVAPITLIVLLLYTAHARWISTRDFFVPLAWVAFLVLSMAFLTSRGHAVHLRYLTPAIVGLYAMLAAGLRRCPPRRSLWPLVCLLAVLYGAIHAGFYLIVSQPDEIRSVPSILWELQQKADGDARG